MKRKLFYYTLIGVTSFLLMGCSVDMIKNLKKNQDNNSHVNGKEVSNLHHIETKDYIKNAIDKANLIAGDRFIVDGNRYYFSKTKYAYSYYGKKVKQLRQSPGGEILAIMEDGSVYNGNTLITDEYDVRDILWQTNNVDVNAYMITENGQVLWYANAFANSQSGESNRMRLEEGAKGIIAGCRNRASQTLFLSEEGELLGANAWEGCEVNHWENVVVMACTKNDDEGFKSIAAIAGDGTVYATGDYSEEILSWGNLAYITMNEYLIVGMKEDGTLAFAGPEAERFKDNKFGKVQAVRIYDNSFIILTEDGIIYNPVSGSDYGVLNAEGGTVEGMSMMDENGKIYALQNEHWKPVSCPAAVKDGEENLLYYMNLQEDKINWGMDESYNQCDSEDLSFQIIDCNNDGKNEILLENRMASHADGYFGVAMIYNGDFRVFLVSGKIEGYYPKSSVIVSSYEGNGGYTDETYWQFSDGKAKKIVKKEEYYDYSSETEVTNYIMDKERASDLQKENAQVNEIGEIEIDQSEFDELLKKYIGEEKRTEINMNSFIENTEQNCRKEFLSALIQTEQQNSSGNMDSDFKNIENPLVGADGHSATWDCVYFGNYWQKDTNGDGRADKKDEKQPIKWRVLQVEEDDVFLLADCVLDIKPYSDVDGNVYRTWDECTLRSWLNGYDASKNMEDKDYSKENFINSAFVEEEKKILIPTTLEDNYIDKIFLLSQEEVTDILYGFHEKYDIETETRQVYFTDFVKDKEKFDEDDGWWLRPKKPAVKGVAVGNDGRGYDTYYIDSYDGVRPVIHIPLSSSLWSYAGKVSSGEMLKE